MKQKTKIILIATFTVIIFIVFAILMVTMIKKNGECIDDPFSYSAKRLRESGGDYVCSCESLDPELLDFFFSENGIEIVTDKYKGIDFSNLNLDYMKGGD